MTAARHMLYSGMERKAVQATEWNVLIGDRAEEDTRELFFGPLTDEDEFHTLPITATMADILVLCGVFKTKTDARRNGWGADQELICKWDKGRQAALPLQTGSRIPAGFTDFRCGKGKLTRITILA